MTRSSWFLGSGLHSVEILMIVVNLQLKWAKLSRALADTELQNKR